MKNISFSKKLAAYSALALAGAAAANAQIVYHDVNPDVTFNTGDSLAIDIDNDATADYYIKHMFSVNSSFSYGTVGTSFNRQLFMAPLVTGNMQMGSDGWKSWNWYGSALNLNDPIGASGAWVCAGGVDPRSRVFFGTEFGYDVTYGGNPYTGGGIYGNFGDGNDHYMGIKFQIGANTHYGWVRVNVLADVTSMTLKDWAYNATADEQILAGQMTAGVEEGALEGKIFAYDRQLNIQLADANGTVTVYNAVGQVVISQEINNANTVIGMNSFDSGIYNVVVESNGMIMQKKVSL